MGKSKMKKTGIFVKALEKAHNNGYNWHNKDGIIISRLGKEEFIHDIHCHYFSIIFSHEFAKAFFCNDECWIEHLRDMVTYEQPLTYLEKFL